MRKREEIMNESIQGGTFIVDRNSGLILEVLLDIRDLLLEQEGEAV